jgi:hypothetical protein
MKSVQEVYKPIQLVPEKILSNVNILPPVPSIPVIVEQ